MAQDPRLDDPTTGVGNKGATPVLTLGPPPMSLPPVFVSGHLKPPGHSRRTRLRRRSSGCEATTRSISICCCSFWAGSRLVSAS